MSHAAPAARAYVGLGANLGAARDTVELALHELSQLPSTRCVGASSLYRSAPVDASGPDFINAVAALDTALDAESLLRDLLQIEQRFRRERTVRNAPRTLDLDLLAWGDLVCATAELTLPHPRLHRRAFVLMPLCELAPDLELPGLGRLQRWLPGVADQRCERVAP